MGKHETSELLPPEAEPGLESVNAVTIASCAIQQLPKLLHALANMARRSRRQFHRRGVLLGGQWLEKECESGVPGCRRGILKTGRYLGMDQLSAYNDFWNVYTFSFHCPSHIQCTFRFRSRILNHRRDAFGCHPVFSGQLCTQNLQAGLYKSQNQTFLESLPPSISTLSSLQNILLRYLRHEQLTRLEQSILVQLQYLRILFNTPLHKLVRERPKEFLIPLPRRHCRPPSQLGGIPKPSYARGLTTYQTVLGMPNPDNGFKWLNLSVSNSFFSFGKNNGNSRTRSTAVPKGVAFITYPDSVDETSFEGTIGDRNVISWEKGTRFPQMGIDQSKEFKYKKEMGKQHMIQSRLRAARIYRRIYCDNWNNYVNGHKQGVYRTCPKSVSGTRAFRRKTGQKKLRGTTTLFKSWFKLAHLKRSLRAWKNINVSTSATTSPTLSTDSLLRDPIGKKARKLVRKAERRKRLKRVLFRILKYLSCGLITFCMKGECRIFKRKRLRTSDSTERCPTPPLPTVPKVEPVVGTSSSFGNGNNNAIKDLLVESIMPP